MIVAPVYHGVSVDKERFTNNGVLWRNASIVLLCIVVDNIIDIAMALTFSFTRVFTRLYALSARIWENPRANHPQTFIRDGPQLLPLLEKDDWKETFVRTN